LLAGVSLASSPSPQLAVLPPGPSRTPERFLEPPALLLLPGPPLLAAPAPAATGSAAAAAPAAAAELNELGLAVAEAVM
jgi:hypothetical protein